MKLLMCPNCRDVVALSHERRTCLCGECAGRYLPDGKKAEYSGDPLLFGVDSRDLIEALLFKASDFAEATSLRAFVIPRTAESLRRVPPEPVDR